MKLPCIHNVLLPKGMRCNHGYLEILLTNQGRLYCRVFGKHTKESQAIAEIHLAEKRKEIMLGNFGMSVPLPRKRFDEVANIWFDLWANEIAPDGKQAHTEGSQRETKRVIAKALVPVFGAVFFDEIKPIDIERWRETKLAEGLSGTSLNRYQATLSSVFSHVDRWIKTEKIKPAFKVPTENPSKPVEKAPTVKRDKVLTKYEAKKLKFAFEQLNDTDGWEICKLALKSVLSIKDLRNLEIGAEIDIERAKTGVPVNLPLPVLVKLNWTNWSKRWKTAREMSGVQDLQFRDLRKTGINWLKGRHDLKLVSEYAGHADIKTTEKSYTIKQAEYLEPLARDLEGQVEEI